MYYSVTRYNIDIESPVKFGQIMFYNAKTGHSEVIVENAPDTITQFFIRGDDLYYVVNDIDDEGVFTRNFYKTSVNGGGKSICLTTGLDKNLLYFASDGDYVYLNEPDFGEIYRTDWTFKSIELMKTVSYNAVNSCYIHDGYLYYYVVGEAFRKEWTQIVDDEERSDIDLFWFQGSYFNLVRVLLDDIYGEEELIAEHVQPSQNSKFYDNKIICMEQKYDYYRSREVYDTFDQRWIYESLYTTTGDLYTVDLYTLEKEVILPYKYYDVYSVHYINDEFMILTGMKLDVNAETDLLSWTETFKYNRITGEITVIDSDAQW